MLEKVKVDSVERAGVAAMKSLATIAQTRGESYPWDKWFRRSKFLLIKGMDYRIGADRFAQQVRQAACKRGLKVSLRIDAEESISVVVMARRRI